ncbi:mpv17-like protein [Ruditapes philippinarum]|uniref:mpv17-like protein n=1 Tax=Ruditapes philippinarum TaxID=129788 RepID=UPI00295ADA47|nr:mpv17-like protein [Ruditapes philippinarum]XP_060597430.1 mpv17-like protein [Ruditapes philippinarum]
MISKLIAKYPVIKTMSAYFCINVAADFNEQVLFKGRTRETYDRGKTARIAATCTFVTSPIMFVWIRFIDKAIPGKALLSVMKKVLSDACFFAPCIISTFYITTNILEGKKDLTEEWKQKFYPTWTTGLCYWPFVQTVNFALIPMKYKTCLYMPTASFIWMNYLCYMKDKKVIHENEEKEESSMQHTCNSPVSNNLMPVFQDSAITNIPLSLTVVQNKYIYVNLSDSMCSEKSGITENASIDSCSQNCTLQPSNPQTSQPSENGASCNTDIGVKSGLMFQSPDIFTMGVILCPH